MKDCRFCDEFEVLNIGHVHCDATDEDLDIDFREAKPVPSKRCPKQDE